MKERIITLKNILIYAFPHGIREWIRWSRSKSENPYLFPVSLALGLFLGLFINPLHAYFAAAGIGILFSHEDIGGNLMDLIGVDGGYYLYYILSWSIIGSLIAAFVKMFF